MPASETSQLTRGEQLYQFAVGGQKIQRSEPGPFHPADLLESEALRFGVESSGEKNQQQLVRELGGKARVRP